MTKAARRIAPVAFIFLLPGVSVQADATDYLDSFVFAQGQLCEVLDGSRDPMGEEGAVLTAAHGTPEFFYIGYPLNCRIDGTLAPQLYGRGSDLETSMVAVSCIDDTAVPWFGIVALEYWPGAEGDHAKMQVFPVAGGEELDFLPGEYTACMGAELDLLPSYPALSAN